MSIPKHLKEHAILGIPMFESGLTGSAIIDMDFDDYVMSATESASPLILVVNPGDGTKVLTIGDYSTTPTRQTIYVLGVAPIGVKFGANTRLTAAYPLSACPVVHFDGSGMYRDESSSIIFSSVGGTTTAANTNEQVIEQIIIPASAWRVNETVTVNFSALKSNTATTETLRVRIGNQGDTTDVEVWVNTGMATTAVGLSMSIKIQRLSATTVAVVSTKNNVSPFGISTSASSFQAVTVDDMDASPIYISVTGQNSTGAETVTSKYIRVEITS
jgi:hypothetical protein